MNNKDKIAEVAFFLALKNGFNEVSIKKIREVAELPTGSIYYHFKNKDEILEYIVNVYLLKNFHKFIDAVRNFKGSFLEKIGFILKYLTNFNRRELNVLNFSIYESCNKAYFVLLASIYHQYPQIGTILSQIHDELSNFFHF